MNIQNRLKKMESRIIKEDKNQSACDLSRLTIEQLLKIKTLCESSDKAELIKYTKQLIDEGLLMRHTS